MCNFQELYAQLTLYLWVLYLSENQQRLLPLQHKLIGLYNRNEKSLQRGTHWAFKKSGLRLCHLQLKRIGFYNRNGKCLQRSKNWAFK
jgi:hypothetical protein